MAFYNNVGIPYPHNYTDALMDGSVIATREHQLRGELITVETNADLEMVQIHDKLSEDRIKLELVNKLVEYMFKNDKIQFTKQLDHSMGTYTYRAYVYVTPNDQTNVVRTLKK
jgi:hypothetical protein